MSVAFTDGVETIARFVVNTAISERARQRASIAVIDTCGVMLAGAGEPAARIAQSMAAEEGVGECRVVGTSIATSPALAAFANGVAAHALDYDDMCFVSLAHPSCVLVPAILAAGEVAHADARTLLDAYVVGFEIECRLGARDEPAALPSARMALHFVDRHARRRGRCGTRARARRARRRVTRSASRPRRRAD